MDDEVKARLQATDAEILRLRERVHKLEGEVPTIKLNMNELTLETKSQTPLLRQVHGAVLGPEGLGEVVRKHERYLSTQNRLLMCILTPLLSAIALATCYAAFSKQAPIKPDVAKQIVEQLKEAVKP